MRRTTNISHIEGYVYEHKLELKESGPTSKNPGTEYINGTLSIATDEDSVNVVSVHYSYVTEFTSKGKQNNTYSILKAIIDGKIGSIMEHGKENAGKVRIDSAIDLNEWFDSRNDNQLISVKRNEGGFIHQTNDLCKPEDRATFETDIVITGTRRIEANEDRGTPEKVIVKGYIFNFRNELLPVEYSVLEPAGALDYFESLEASESAPVFTKVKGKQVSQTVIRTIEEEGAWGDVSIREVKSSYKDFVITWASKAGFLWDDESGILATEMAEMMANRELHLAELRNRQEEYRNNRDNAIPSASNTSRNDFPVF